MDKTFINFHGNMYKTPKLPIFKTIQALVKTFIKRVTLNDKICKSGTIEVATAAGTYTIQSKHKHLRLAAEKAVA